jgi:hypothetical protein
MERDVSVRDEETGRLSLDSEIASDPRNQRRKSAIRETEKVLDVALSVEVTSVGYRLRNPKKLNEHAIRGIVEPNSTLILSDAETGTT